MTVARSHLFLSSTYVFLCLFPPSCVHIILWLSPIKQSFLNGSNFLTTVSLIKLKINMIFIFKLIKIIIEKSLLFISNTVVNKIKTMPQCRNVCAYEGCSNSQQKNPSLSFHRFPSNNEEIW